MRPLRKANLPLNPLKGTYLNYGYSMFHPLGMGRKNIEYQYFTLFRVDSIVDIFRSCDQSIHSATNKQFFLRFATNQKHQDIVPVQKAILLAEFLSRMDIMTVHKAIQNSIVSSTQKVKLNILREKNSSRS